MTKDEYVSPSGIGPLFDAGLAAGRDAALANTLGLLEALAKMGDDVVWRGLQVRYSRNLGKFIYFRPVDNLVNLVYLSRAEVEALLAREEKKE